MIKYFIILLVGFIAQMIDGGLSMGFGVVSTSFMLNLGIGTTLASATVHLAEIFTTLFSGLSHLKMGNVDKRIFVPLTISGVIGGIIGVYLSISLQETQIIRPFVSSILLLLGTVIVFRFIRKGGQTEHQVPKKRKLFLIGFPAALVDALGGGGWGPITTPSLIFHNSDPKKAIGSVSLSEFFITLSIAVSFFVMMPEIDWRVVAPLLIGGVVASPISAYIVKKMPVRTVGVLVGILVVILSLRTILKSLGVF